MLPAGLLVLAVSAVTTFALVPLALWRQFLGEIVSSVLYVENWTLAANAVDYFASVNIPSLSQHYWSLAATATLVAVGVALTLALTAPVSVGAQYKPSP